MENKKQLIIIPPMSEALRKLHEVLTGIAEDENMEISIIDDLKELSQFVANTGQCIILASNAKKCATLLQDNKATLGKLHCKTILFTPKEIPAKTLVKFTKVGLTESILESLPPKTFVYKVKLLLRSIKTAKPQDEAEKTVKSLEIQKTIEEAAEKEQKEKNTKEIEEAGTPEDLYARKKMEDTGEAIDYGGNLKGKTKPQEEIIDTNWRSDRKKDGTTFEEEAASKKGVESDDSNIDMYYRGKQQRKIDLFADEDPYKREKKKEFEETIDLKKKRHSEADVIEEGYFKQKRREEDAAPEEAQKERRQTEINLISDKKEKETSKDEELERKPNVGDLSAEETIEDKKNILTIDDADDSPPESKVRKIQDEDKQELTPEPEMEYETAQSGKKKSTDLELEAADKDDREKKKTEEEKEDSPGMELDDEQGPNHMGGSEGQVDHIETMMTSKFDPNKNKASAQEDKDLDLEMKKEETSSSKDLKQESLIDEANSELDLDGLPKLTREDDSELDMTQKATLIEAAEKEKKNRTLEEAHAQEMNDKTSSSLLAVEASDKNREKMTKDDENELNLRSSDKFDPLAKKERDQVHNSQVEKIDTFYRGGEGKKNDQNWDGLNKRNASIDLLVAKSTRAPDGVMEKADKDLGETTIDYRKLKEEFDMISNGEIYSGDSGVTGARNNALKNDDDDGSFKVVEIDPKSLDFAIHIINAIYEKDMKPKKMFTLMANEILNNYHCFPVFYSYKLSDKKFNEVFNIFTEPTNNLKVTTEIKDWWHEFKKDTAMFEHYQSKSMTTWRCQDVIKDDVPWEDVELPTWAEQELKDKRVELIFPYFDGIDRMGMAVVFFPDGLNHKTALGLLTLLEMARTLFLDTIERYQVKPTNSIMDEPKKEEAPKTEEKKNVLSFLGGLFGRKKAG